MAELLYCWRCKMEIPMLDDAEAMYIFEPPESERRILDRYFEVTGFNEPNQAAVYHHVIAQYGPPCSNCGRPLRTPRARWCAACGASVPD
jgi:hypothetical protein